MANSGKITRGQEAAIGALLCYPSVPEAAKAIGLADRTLYRWLRREDFKQAYQEARREVVHHAVVQLQGSMGAAVATLGAVMRNEDATASARVAAARAMLDFGLRAAELEDLDHRITEVERYLAERR